MTRARSLERFVGELWLCGSNRRPLMRKATGSLLELLEGRGGRTLQQRWQAVENELWPQWDAGRGRLEPARQWTWGTAALVLSRAVRPGWVALPRARLSQWLRWLPAEHPLPARYAGLCAAVAAVGWATHVELKRRAGLLGLRILLAGGHAELEEIRDEDLKAVPVACAQGIDVLDAALCQLGVLVRTPQRGAQRRLRRGDLSPAELVERSHVPERFRSVHPALRRSDDLSDDVAAALEAVALEEKRKTRRRRTCSTPRSSRGCRINPHELLRSLVSVGSKNGHPRPRL